MTAAFARYGNPGRWQSPPDGSVESLRPVGGGTVNPSRVDSVVDLTYGLLIAVSVGLIVVAGNAIGLAFGFGVLVSYVLHVGWKMARFDPDWMTTAVKETVDETVEESVEKTVGETVDETVEKSVEEAVEKTVGETVDETVDETVGETVEKSIEETVEKSVEKTVDETVETAVEETVDKKIEEKIEETESVVDDDTGDE